MTTEKDIDNAEKAYSGNSSCLHRAHNYFRFTHSPNLSFHQLLIDCSACLSGQHLREPLVKIEKANSEKLRNVLSPFDFGLTDGFESVKAMYLKHIGGNMNYEVPTYTDFCYKGRFIRMITGQSYVCDEKGYAHLTWHIKNMKIPASVWEDRDIIVKAIFEAFAATVDEDFITSKAVLECESECVDHDYNGN